MSRSNPVDTAVNPAVRWFEWNGEAGSVRYYDKEQKKSVDVGADFGFILLDQLASVRGWDDASSSGIYSNEVRDTRQEVMVVKSFKGGTMAEGLYRDIKDRVNTAGGNFTTSCYIGFKHNGGLEIGCIRFKGAALSAWMEFTKAHRNELYSMAMQIDGYTEGKKGRVVFRVPIFKVKPISPEKNSAAVALDKKLQEYLTLYFKRTTTAQVSTPPADVEHPPVDDLSEAAEPKFDGPINDDDIPF